jgi:hypothetical protein
VSQSFSAHTQGTKSHNIRQDAIIIGDENTHTLSENPLMTGVVKMLGLDSSKIVATVVNGIILISSAVRYSVMTFMDYMMTKTWDWYKIVDTLSDKITNSSELNPAAL